MEKIFDADFRKELTTSLITAGIAKSEALKVVNDTYNAKLINAVTSRLRSIADALERKDFNTVKRCLRYSPAGDCCGRDNTYIGFDDICNDEVSDIGNVYYKLTGEQAVDDGYGFVAEDDDDDNEWDDNDD